MFYILTLLGGDEVTFEEIKPGTIIVKSGSCVYTLRILNGRTYPRPEIPFPDTTVNLSDIKQMYSKTYAAAGGDVTSGVFMGIHFNINPNGFRIESCNARDIAIAENKMTCGGSMDFTLSKQTVSYLSAAAGNEGVEVGTSGPFVIFMKEGMLFSAKRISSEFVDVNKLLNSLEPVYTAALEGEKFKEEIPKYMVKHQVRPGVTGWAQVNGLRGDTSIEKRIQHDIYYIEHWSLLLDIRIMFLTVINGFINKNAY